jgi:hypothetical protein
LAMCSFAIFFGDLLFCHLLWRSAVLPSSLAICWTHAQPIAVVEADCREDGADPGQQAIAPMVVFSTSRRTPSKRTTWLPQCQKKSLSFTGRLLGGYCGG